jgi:hypothetical protein
MDDEFAQLTRPRQRTAPAMRISTDDLVALGSAGAVIGLIVMQVVVHL